MGGGWGCFLKCSWAVFRKVLLIWPARKSGCKASRKIILNTSCSHLENAGSVILRSLNFEPTDLMTYSDGISSAKCRTGIHSGLTLMAFGTPKLELCKLAVCSTISGESINVMWIGCRNFDLNLKREAELLNN